MRFMMIVIVLLNTIFFSATQTFAVSKTVIIPPSIYVKESNGVIRVAFKYDNSNDMWLDFKKSGINAILGLQDIYLAYNKKLYVSSYLNRKANIFLKSCSDWLGPYIVQALENCDYNYPEFTGGWHEINGKPTAKTISYSVYADGKTVKLNKVTGCKTLKIDVINMIQGYNTTTQENGKGRDILKETVHYTVTKGNINVSVEIEALEDIIIDRYYGLQTLNSAWDGKIVYLKGLDNGLVTRSQRSNSGAKIDYPNVERFCIYSNKSNHKLTAWLDRKYGLGNMEYVADDVPCAFTENYGKSYFNLVNGIGMDVEKGEKLKWRGGYIFEKY